MHPPPKSLYDPRIIDVHVLSSPLVGIINLHVPPGKGEPSCNAAECRQGASAYSPANGEPSHASFEVNLDSMGRCLAEVVIAIPGARLPGYRLTVNPRPRSVEVEFGKRVLEHVVISVRGAAGMGSAWENRPELVL